MEGPQAPGAIHPRARLDPGAQVHPTATVGPLAWVAAGARLGPGVRVGPRAVVGGGVEVGEASFVDVGAVVGSPAASGGEVSVRIGRGVRVREYAVVEPGRESPTRVDDHAFVMGRSRVGAGSRVGERAVLTHAAVLGPGACLEAGAVVGGFAVIEAGVVVGRGAMVAAMSRVRRPVPPYVLVHGNPARPVGLNVVGLRRAGVPPEARAALQRAFRLLFRGGLSLEDAAQRLARERQRWPQLEELLAFLGRYGLPEAPAGRGAEPS